MDPRTLFTLILCNVIWSAHPTMGKLVLRDLSPDHAAWARYALALVAYAIAARAVPKLLPAGGAFVKVRQLKGSSFAWLSLVGFLAFCFSPVLQFSGLSITRAVDSALIVAMEPLMAVLLAWMILGESLQLRHWISLALALAGFAALSDLTFARFTSGWSGHLWGNAIMLISLSGEAAYSVFGRKLIKEGKNKEPGRFPASQVFGTALLIGVLLLTLVTWTRSGPPALGQLTALGWMGLLWMGVLGTSIGYLIWAQALKTAPVASLSLTLFIQPVLGAVWGVVFLDERLSPSQWLGAVLILASVIGGLGLKLSGIRSRRPKARRPVPRES